MDELNKFSKRIKRYTDLGSSAGIVAAKYFGSKFKTTLMISFFSTHLLKQER